MTVGLVRGVYHGRSSLQLRTIPCIGAQGFLVGLNDQDPVNILGGHPADSCALQGIQKWACRYGIILLRFARLDAGLWDRVASVDGVPRVGTFPFYTRDRASLFLMVHQELYLWDGQSGMNMTHTAPWNC